MKHIYLFLAIVFAYIVMSTLSTRQYLLVEIAIDAMVKENRNVVGGNIIFVILNQSL